MDKLKKLEEILKKIEAYETLGGDVPTTKEVADVFDALVKVMKEAVVAMEKRVSNGEGELSKKGEELSKKMREIQEKWNYLSSLEEKGKMMEDVHGKVSMDMKGKMDEILSLYTRLKSINASDIATQASRIALDALKPLVPTPDTLKKELAPRDIVEKLESLGGENRLDKKAIKGIEEIEKEIAGIPRGRVMGGARGIQLYTDSTKRGMANTVNFLAGAGITLTYTYSSGRNDITLSATAGGASEVPTGTVDGSNTVFTFVASPKVIIVDQGRTLILNNGFTADATGLIITVDIAPNFSIFSI